MFLKFERMVIYKLTTLFWFYFQNENEFKILNSGFLYDMDYLISHIRSSFINHIDKQLDRKITQNKTFVNVNKLLFTYIFYEKETL